MALCVWFQGCHGGVVHTARAGVALGRHGGFDVKQVFGVGV